MKIALVHDWLVGVRGGEKVLEDIIICLENNFNIDKLDIYTLVHRKNSQRKTIEEKEIKTSFIQKLPFGVKKYRYYLPLFPIAIESFNLMAYDAVISSSHAVAKGVLTSSDSVHICYCHTPMRYIWEQYFEYFGKSKGIKSLIYKVISNYLKIWDVSSSNRVDIFIANSLNVKNRIEKHYRRNATIVFPPVDTDFYNYDEKTKREDYFLVVSALVPYKRVDLAIEAFNDKYPLKIVGCGPEKRKLKKKAHKNIEFLENVSDKKLREYYSKAKALIFTSNEDFGIVPLEAQACGTPVIAYKKGGALETIKEGKTGIFFPEHTASSLLKGIDKFLNSRFNRGLLRENSMKFSRQVFRNKFAKNFKDTIKEKQID